jgi:hypothetical protein
MGDRGCLRACRFCSPRPRRAASGLRRQLFRFTPADPARQYPRPLVPLEEWLRSVKKLHEKTWPPVWVDASSLELEDPPGTQGIWD